ncbi:hypothetical protein N7528_003596 [Penicillium herquei]|nr:hypothetical protein N7528_003596 [Penicillium herquei]
MDQARFYGGFDPCRYTSGRWLRNDKFERQARYIDVNFELLCRKVIEISNGAESIVSCEKKEGGFNRVFIFTMDDGSRVIARLPFVISGPARLTTASEVATIHYLETNTSIPVPKILAWNDDATNDIGSEYIIMECMPGIFTARKMATHV